jgi:hypothetical protein
MRRRTSVALQECAPETFSATVRISNQQGSSFDVNPTELEGILSPVVVLSPGHLYKLHLA